MDFRNYEPLFRRVSFRLDGDTKEFRAGHLVYYKKRYL